VTNDHYWRGWRVLLRLESLNDFEWRRLVERLDKAVDNLSCQQTDLFGAAVASPSLPRDYDPVRPAYFEVERIYLARGSIATAERKRFVERICGSLSRSACGRTAGHAP
jgi:hypothetical protein